MKKLPLRIAPILALFLPLFSMLSSPRRRRHPAARQLSGLPTATAVAINSPSTTTGHGNTGYGVYGIITGPASATPQIHQPARQPRRRPILSASTLTPNLRLNARAPLYGTIAARAPDGALCLCHQGYAGKPGFWEQIGTGQPCWPDQK